MAKGKGGSLGWKGVSTGTPCSKPEDNRPEYSKSGSPSNWQGVKDTTPSSSGESQSIKIGGKGGE